ncbi:MAG: YfcE family phosphodiesterase [Acholeplasmataceae bacterium]
MKWLITSDIHGDLERLKSVVEKHPDVDYHLDAGDSGLKDFLARNYHAIGVKGNNDFGNHDPTIRIVTLHAKKVLLTHGHREYVKLGLSKLKELAKKEKVDVCIFGHTHKKYLMAESNIIYINPGALGKSPHSYAIYENGQVTFYEENGK